MDSILNVEGKFVEVDSIKSYDYSEYLPTSGSNLNTAGTITIHIENHFKTFLKVIERILSSSKKLSSCPG